MAALLASATTNQSGSGVATSAVDAWIEIPNDSVFDGAIVTIEASSVNTAGKYSPVDLIGVKTSPGWIYGRFPIGTFIRAKLGNVGPNTSVSVNLL